TGSTCTQDAPPDQSRAEITCRSYNRRQPTCTQRWAECPRCFSCNALAIEFLWHAHCFGVTDGRAGFEQLDRSRWRIREMRPTLILVFLVVWLFAEVSGYTLGGRVNVLPVLALVVALLGGRQRPRPV